MLFFLPLTCDFFCHILQEKKKHSCVFTTHCFGANTALIFFYIIAALHLFITLQHVYNNAAMTSQSVSHSSRLLGQRSSAFQKWAIVFDAISGIFTSSSSSSAAADSKRRGTGTSRLHHDHDYHHHHQQEQQHHLAFPRLCLSLVV